MMTLKFLERLDEKTSSNIWRCSNSYFIYYYFHFFIVFFPTPCPNYNITSFYFSYWSIHLVFLIVLVEWNSITFFYACEVYKDWIQLFIMFVSFKVLMFTISRFNLTIFLLSFLWLYIHFHTFVCHCFFF